MIIAEIGLLSLIAALGFCFSHLLLSFISPKKYVAIDFNTHYFSALMVNSQCILVIVSFISLILCFVNNDFSVNYVALHSNTHLPLLYRISAVWGAHEGSLLLWILFLNIWSWALMQSRRIDADDKHLMSLVFSFLNAGFIAFLVFTSNPFTRLLPWPAKEGMDLNPLLQDPGLAIHPPMLYAGYVGLAVAFAMAITALWKKDLSPKLIAGVRPFILLAWCFLTAGITLGSWWAYRVLGWGGWWFWDPVENASFIPWLSGTALIHSLMVSEKKSLFKGWSLLLAISTFAFSLIGTFLVRSGVIVSVHAFASDPTRGIYILYFIAIVIGLALILYAWRAPALPSQSDFPPFSRPTLILINNLLLWMMAFTVLLGTIYPLIIDILGLGKISVGSPYFNTVFLPFMLFAMLFMAIAPFCGWNKNDPKVLWLALRWPLSSSFFLTLGLSGIFFTDYQVVALLSLWISCFLLCSTVFFIYRRHFAPHRLGMALAHIGISITAMAIVLTTALSSEKQLLMQIGDKTPLQNNVIYFQNLTDLNGSNFHGVSGVFKIYTDDVDMGVVVSEKRIFNTSGMTITHPGIRILWWRDIYITLGNLQNEKQWVVRIYEKPFVRWIWFGGILMLLGGLIAVWQQRTWKKTA